METKKIEYVDFVVTARKYKTTLTKKYLDRKPWQPVQPGDVNSHLPGTIVEIMVKEGDHVEKGQLLCIHEAMKMLNRIVAPFAGIVTQVNVKIGDKIAKNHLMMKIEAR
ncbi:acetyl-CoA carboxylase biotin carboxyl carrier protein subunit [Massilibacteroides sp.]|uniref:acetyl-CoA carboxylase biotin carboxyl carrier protein subunit n=1 Tax=Massilibacteroides sp. TaxID=2034766 RepID=UPI0026021BF0|nr:acetyl-CoA carboxylase biotin carboxyl carrier protein subunit [Massilibacteroides sp.]MDD4515589.1 acetyl-CoA carboxylase biotin carboxyl carrier protein subunit [Massilibacteroides sp.]